MYDKESAERAIRAYAEKHGHKVYVDDDGIKLLFGVKGRRGIEKEILDFFRISECLIVKEWCCTWPDVIEIACSTEFAVRAFALMSRAYQCRVSPAYQCDMPKESVGRHDYKLWIECGVDMAHEIMNSSRS